MKLRSPSRPLIRRFAVVLATIVLAAIVSPTGTAIGAVQRIRYTDTGYDPDDVPVDETSCCQQDPDIRASTRKVWIDEQDRKWLTVSFRTWEALIGYWRVRVRLDTRAGHRADAKMWIFDTGTDGAFCTFHRHGSVTQEGSYREVRPDKARCRVPLRWVEPKKRIRWKLFSAGGGEGTGPAVDEYAPDTGWYV